MKPETYSTANLSSQVPNSKDKISSTLPHLSEGHKHKLLYSKKKDNVLTSPKKTKNTILRTLNAKSGKFLSKLSNHKI